MTEPMTSPSTFTTSPFADAVLTPSYAVQSTGPAGDQAVAHEGPMTLRDRPRPVIEIGRRMPLLVGRSAELDELSDRVRAGDSIEIHAGEGFGKTSLLNLLLHDRPDLKGYFADGVVSLSGRVVPDGDLVGALFRTFFQADQAVALDKAEMMRRLSPVRALIVLDDVDEEELHDVIAGLSAPVFLVTSTKRRLHDLPARPVGPLATDDLIAIAEARIGHPLDEQNRTRILALADVVDNQPRSWARALGLIDQLEDLAAVTAQLDSVRDPGAETARMSQDRSGPTAVKAMVLLAELGGAAIGQDLLARLLNADDGPALAAELETRGVGLMVG